MLSVFLKQFILLDIPAIDEPILDDAVRGLPVWLIVGIVVIVALAAFLVFRALKKKKS